MSLLLQALQKAAKSREEGEVDLSRPTNWRWRTNWRWNRRPSASRAHQESSASPTSAQAATVVQAGSVPAFDAMDYAREHYMLSLCRRRDSICRRIWDLCLRAAEPAVSSFDASPVTRGGSPGAPDCRLERTATTGRCKDQRNAREHDHVRRQCRTASAAAAATGSTAAASDRGARARITINRLTNRSPKLRWSGNRRPRKPFPPAATKPAPPVRVGTSWQMQAIRSRRS